ncbi:winged helix-turn-helix domain-containing protein [Aurantiacibacter gangjinensis]|uniref:winged helix-turn-helix domain-containing protein n=1 Tax=Aurantiacibacter gangjinensis TaxID=502682 RepID=UPI00069B549E|nr:transcriptional regulator [Aurantiacibacter gangjinensis]APE29265.1 Signal transduction response regulator [Aurantiacibacter gangjinensis]
MTEQGDPIHFGEFTLLRTQRQLLRGDSEIELGNRYFDALLLLVERRGELVTKDDFLGAVWRGIPVTDEALTQCIRALRKALGDVAGDPRFIQTVPKHGYRFIAPIADGGENTSPAHAAAPLARLAGACTLAGALAGATGGLFYGLVAFDGEPSAVLALGGLVAALGTMLAQAGIGLLTGISITGATGPLEGAIIGAACGAAVWVSHASHPALMRWSTVLALGVLAGLALHLAGGSLLGGTLWNLQRDLGTTGLALDQLGGGTFGTSARMASAAIEAMVFTAAIAFAAQIARK